MNIKTKLLEDYVNFVDTTTKQNTNFKKIGFLFVLIISLFLSYLLFIYLKEKLFFYNKYRKQVTLIVIS